MTIYHSGFSADVVGRDPRKTAARYIRTAVIAVGATALLAGTAAGYVSWRGADIGGTTAGAGDTGLPTAEPVAANAFTDGLLFPDGPKGTVRVTIHNPNPYPVRLTAVTPAGNRAVTASGGKGTCSGGAVTFRPVNLDGGVALGAAARTTLTLPGTATMSGAAEDGCQGALFRIPVSVTVVHQ